MGKKKLTGWGALSTEQRDALLADYEARKPVSVPGILDESLKRKLREWRQIRRGAEPTTGRTGTKVVVEDHNNMSVQATGRITTLDELLSYCKVDTKLWEVERYVANSWEVGVRHEEKDLYWEGGSIQSGRIKSSGGVNRENLVQIKAWLVRKKPIELRPVISPVEFSLPALEYAEHSYAKGAGTALIIPDIHFGYSAELHRRKLEPFHDRAALSLVLGAAEAYQPDYIIMLGDILDLADWSDKFLRSPEFYNLTQPAIIEAGWFLAQLAIVAPNSKRVLIEGNHEIRFRNAIMKHLAAGFNLRAFDEQELTPAMSIPRLLGLHTIGWEWVGDYPNGLYPLTDYLYAEHGSTTGAPGQVASKVIKDLSSSVVFGHLHRFELAAKTLFDASGAYDIYGFSSGFLGRIDGKVPPGKIKQQWQQGFSLVYFTEDGDISFYPVPISNGQGIVDPNDRVWVGDGKGLREALIEDTGTDWSF